MFEVDAPVRVPTSRYTSPEWATLEEQRLWPHVWQLACTADHVAAPGDFFEHRVGRLSVLIVRGDDGELRAFQNVCRHRGNPLCEGSGRGLTELRCGFHRWTWDLHGELREVPSRKRFGTMRNEDDPLFAASVDTWGPLVFVNLDPDAAPLAEYLEGVPEDIEWAGLEDFRCTTFVEVPVVANWKTAVDGFSETYHLQGLHREMLAVVDDVDTPQRLWDRHGKSMQRYGVPSPRLGGGVTDQEVWDAFILVMGTRIGVPTDADPGPAPTVPEGSTLVAVIARARARVPGGARRGSQRLRRRRDHEHPAVQPVPEHDVARVRGPRPGAAGASGRDARRSDPRRLLLRTPRGRRSSAANEADGREARARGRRLRARAQPGLRAAAAGAAGAASARDDPPHAVQPRSAGSSTSTATWSARSR